MSITIRTQPSALSGTLRPVAAFNPVIFEVGTTRADVVQKTISTVANSGGFLKITTTTAHGYQTGDVVTNIGVATVATGTKSVISVTSITEFVCSNIAWASGMAASGTVTKSNTGVIIRADVMVGSSVYASHYARQEYNNGTHDVYGFDLGGVLSDYIDNNNNGTDLIEASAGYAYSPAQSYASVEFTVVFTELFDDASGIQQTGSQATSAACRAFNMAVQTGYVIGDYICRTTDDPNFVLSPSLEYYLRTTESVTIQCNTSESSVGVKTVSYTASGTTSTTWGPKATVNNARVQVTISPNLFGEGTVRWDVSFYASTSTVISNTVSIYRRTGCVRNAYRIQYRNLLGGVDSIHCNDGDMTSNNTSTTLNTTTGAIVVWNVVNERTVQVDIAGTPTQLLAYEQLLTSRFIWLNGERVELENRKQKVRSRDYMEWTLVFRRSNYILN